MAGIIPLVQRAFRWAFERIVVGNGCNKCAMPCLASSSLGSPNRIATSAVATAQLLKSSANRLLPRMGGSVNTIAECTVPEKILLAAFQLEEHGQSPFSAEALIVAVWQKYPRTFGLKGYDEQYPDSNKVLASIMGEKGLTRRGWLSKTGQKLYALTHEGRRVVRRLLQGDDQPVAKSDRPVKLPRDHDKLLQGLFVTSAYEKYPRGPAARTDLRRRLPILEHHREPGRRCARRPARSPARRPGRDRTASRPRQHQSRRRPQHHHRRHRPAVRHPQPSVAAFQPAPHAAAEPGGAAVRAASSKRSREPAT